METQKYISSGKKIFQEFKDFISRGNVLNLAVAVIVGGAFMNIVNALVNYIITPIIGIFLGGINFGGLSITIHDAVIKYGLFLQAVINFLIVGFVIFIIVKIVSKLERTVTSDGSPTDFKNIMPVSNEVKELREIKELLKKMNQNQKPTL